VVDIENLQGVSLKATEIMEKKMKKEILH